MPRREQDPFGSFRFKLELGDVEVAGFAECTGLNIETKVLEYKEGGNNATTLKFPEPSTFGNVTLKRGVTNSNELIEWQLDVVSGTFGKNSRANNPGIAIVLMNEKGEDVRRWNLIRAFPVKWVGPDLKASASEVAIETLELAHEGIQI
ncbi:MAG TPA: phage tail protein [Pyrinomonadaceae bacterium]|jgi:phage tail-like protein